jgi:hypothetical protein
LPGIRGGRIESIILPIGYQPVPAGGLSSVEAILDFAGGIFVVVNKCDIIVETADSQVAFFASSLF